MHLNFKDLLALRPSQEALVPLLKEYAAVKTHGEKSEQNDEAPFKDAPVPPTRRSRTPRLVILSLTVFLLLSTIAAYIAVQPSAITDTSLDQMENVDSHQALQDASKEQEFIESPAADDPGFSDDALSTMDVAVSALQTATAPSINQTSSILKVPSAETSAQLFAPTETASIQADVESRFLVVASLFEGQARSNTHLAQTASIAKMLNRTLVLPNVVGCFHQKITPTRVDPMFCRSIEGEWRFVITSTLTGGCFNLRSKPGDVQETLTGTITLRG